MRWKFESRPSSSNSGSDRRSGSLDRVSKWLTNRRVDLDLAIAQATDIVIPFMPPRVKVEENSGQIPNIDRSAGITSILDRAVLVSPVGACVELAIFDTTNQDWRCARW